MATDYSKVDWRGLAKKIKNLRATGLRKNEHAHNACNFKRLARELDDAMGTAAYGYFERHVEAYMTAACKDYGARTGKALEKIAFLAKRDLGRSLQDWRKGIYGMC